MDGSQRRSSPGLAETSTSIDYRDVWADVIDAVLPELRSFRRSLTELKRSTKADGTLLTEADLVVQDLITRTVLRHDPRAHFVAEEELRAPAPAPAPTAPRTWVVDPIDGTSQYVDAEAVEYCSVVAVLVSGCPVACLVVAPELGAHRTPVVLTVSPGQSPLLNGVPAARAGPTRFCCVTRSSRRPPTAVEVASVRRGLVTKTRSTSQTLDMVRTILDLESSTGLPSFRWFVARRQLLWDAAAGLALARAVGAHVYDRHGVPMSVVPRDILTERQPRLDLTVIADPADAEWICGLSASD